MNAMKSWLRASVLLLALSLVITGCYAPAQYGSAAGFSAGIFAPSVSRGVIVNELKAAREDLKIIDDLINDQDLGLLEEEDSSDSSDMTEEDITFFMGLLEGHNGRINGALTAIKARQAVEDKDMEALRTAEIAQFELARDVVEEYMQVLQYIQSLLDLSGQMDAIGKVNATDPAGMYESISQAINTAIKNLQSSEVPTFLKSMNDNMIASLNEMNDAVLYSLVAEDINDPVRRNGAAYRMGILEREFTKISTDAETDTEDRMKKLKDDVNKIQQVNEGLSKWVQDNLNKLS